MRMQTLIILTALAGLVINDITTLTVTMTPLLQLWSGQRDCVVVAVSHASSCASDSEKWL